MFNNKNKYKRTCLDGSNHIERLAPVLIFTIFTALRLLFTVWCFMPLSKKVRFYHGVISIALCYLFQYFCWIRVVYYLIIVMQVISLTKDTQIRQRNVGAQKLLHVN